MGTKMSNAPVFFTLAQVRFNPVSVMGEFAPKIQERLRLDGYPDFRTEQLHRIELKQVGEDSEVQTLGVVRWSFLNSKGTEGFVLNPDSLVFHTTVYDSFHVFLESLEKGLKLVHDIVGLAYIERIGLRYLDAVSPKPGEQLGQYLAESVLGLSAVLEGTLAHSFTETIVQNNVGTLVSRVAIRDDGLGIPPDLYPLRLKVGERFEAITGRNATLDNDHFVEERMDFDPSEVETRLLAMHDVIEKAFKGTVTPYALEQWK